VIPPPGLDARLSQFLLDHLPLIEIRFTLREAQTVELYDSITQIFLSPNLTISTIGANLDECRDRLTAYRRALLN
jgi:hypothetical protein